MNKKHAVMSIKTKQITSLIILFILLSTVGCGHEKIKKQDLEGDWITVTAKRNGKKTQTLENVSFSFQNDSIFSTNLFGEKEVFNINYSLPTIEIQSSKIEELNVIKLSGDTLYIFTRINQFRYDFELMKNSKEL